MMNEAIAKLVLFTTVLIITFGAIVVNGIRTNPIKQFNQSFADALNKWIQTQICLQCNVTMEDLDKRAKKRIAGAAAKAIKPLREAHQIELQLPNIVRGPNGEWRHFMLKVSIEDIRHLVPKGKIPY